MSVFLEDGGKQTSFTSFNTYKEFVSEGPPPSGYTQYEGFDISYWTFGIRDAWNETETNEAGVPFNQASLNKYNHAFAFRPQFLTLTVTGVIEEFGGEPGDYSVANLALYKANCEEFWFHISNSDYDGMVDLVSDPLGKGQDARDAIVAKVVEWDAKGVDINFESFADYTVQFVTDFSTWLGALKTDLNAVGCVLSYAIVSIYNSTVQNFYNFDYSSFIDDVDFLTVMMYDMFDFGFGLSNSPIQSIIGGSQTLVGNPGAASTPTYESNEGFIVTFYTDGILGKIFSDVGDKMDKIICGLPNYGMYNPTNADNNYNYVNNIGLNRINLGPEYDTNISSGVRTTDETLRWSAPGVFVPADRVTLTGMTPNYFDRTYEFVTTQTGTIDDSNVFSTGGSYKIFKFLNGPNWFVVLYNTTRSGWTVTSYGAIDDPDIWVDQTTYTPNEAQVDIVSTSILLDGDNVPDDADPKVAYNSYTSDDKYLEFYDAHAVRERIKAIRDWFDDYETDNPANKKPHREICIWYMGSNNETPFD